MEGTAFWIAAVLAAMCVGLGKGGVPVITALSVPMLSLVISPIAAAGLLLPVYIAADIFGLMAYWRSFDRRILAILMVAMPIGVLIGYLTASSVSDALVTLIIGLVGGSFALNMILNKPADGPPQQAGIARGLFWGTITGFTSFVSHSGATPFQVYVLPLRLPKLVFAGTMIVAFSYINAIKLIPYYLLGQLNIQNLQITAYLFAPAIAAVFVGVRLVKILPEKLFFRIVVWMLLLISLRLIWAGLAGL